MERAVAGVERKERAVLIDLLRRLGLGAAENAERLPDKSVAARGSGKRSRRE